MLGFTFMPRGGQFTDLSRSGEQFSDMLGSGWSSGGGRRCAVGREVVLQTVGAAVSSAAGATSHCFLFSPRPPPLGLKSAGGLNVSGCALYAWCFSSHMEHTWRRPYLQVPPPPLQAPVPVL